MRLFQKIAKMRQHQLKKWLLKRYIGRGYKVHNGDGYLYLEPEGDGATPVCLVAHLDTVHKELPREIVVERHPGRTIISSPQGIGGDDRCGVWIIARLLDSGFRPHVIFCEDEEIGCVGSRKFAKSGLAEGMGKEINFMVQLDRKGSCDAVYYDLDNAEFEDFISETTGFSTAQGSYSDICELAPAADVAAVNLSCGYYKEHTLEHYVVWEEMLNTLEAAAMLLNVKSERFEWNEALGIKDWFGEYGQYTIGYFIWTDAKGELKMDSADGYSEMEAVGNFMAAHRNLCLNDVDIDFEYY